MNYWLFKSEPNEFSIDDLANVEFEFWDGIRNYQARNFMRDEVKKGDKVLFYHSNCKDVGVVGIAKVVSGAKPDPTQFDPECKYFDAKSDPENPRWYGVDVAFVKKITPTISLSQLKTNPKLAEFQLVKRGNRLSILPVTKAYWDIILKH